MPKWAKSLCLMLSALSGLAQGLAQVPNSVTCKSGHCPRERDRVPTSSGLSLKKGVVVYLQIDAIVGSKISKTGQLFPMSLTRSLLSSDGMVLLPSGSQVEGEVVHAAKAGGSGRAGELIVRARAIICGPHRIPVGHFQFVEAGTDRSKTSGSVAAAAAGAAALTPLGGFGGIIGLAIRGGDVAIPTGTPGEAKIVADVPMTTSLIQSCRIDAERGNGNSDAL